MIYGAIPAFGINRYLSGIDEAKVNFILDEEAKRMDYFQKNAQADELKSQIAQTDSEIDTMVYDLYGFTGEEIRVVEGVFD